ncbi:MAG: hypothetical protein FJ265_09255 [Planctomycetes bacterium]|nr:hypothetical protein [Planctomycetota bacterium]
MPRRSRPSVPPPKEPLSPAWQHVVEIAVTVGELAPWQHFAPDALVGVLDPASGETDWCVAMGHDGELYGVAIYAGDAGYASWLRVARGEVDEFDAPLVQRAITLTFESAATVLPATKRIHQALGRRFRGAHAWPELLVHEPGYFPIPPWHDRQLHRAANALAGVAALLPWAHGDPHGGRCPVEGKAWCTQPPFRDRDLAQVALPEVHERPAAPPPFDQLATARLLNDGRPRQGPWLLDWFCGPSVVDGPEAEGRPFFLVNLLVIHLASEMILGVDAVRLDRVAAGLQELVASTVTKVGLPQELLVRRGDLAALLQPFAQALGAPLRHDPHLVEVTRAVHDEFVRFVGG